MASVLICSNRRGIIWALFSTVLRARLISVYRKFNSFGAYQMGVKYTHPENVVLQTTGCGIVHDVVPWKADGVVSRYTHAICTPSSLG